jgi:transcriptional regulator with GAF, ATPase, and Fis domain
MRTPSAGDDWWLAATRSFGIGPGSRTRCMPSCRRILSRRARMPTCSAGWVEVGSDDRNCRTTSGPQSIGICANSTGSRSSPGDVEPVFAVMLEKAVRICDAGFGNIYRWDGEALHLVAAHNTPPAFAEDRAQRPETLRNAYISRMVATKSVVHVSDLKAERSYLEHRISAAVAAVELGGVRAFLLVPMLKEDELIGAIILNRPEVRPFTGKQIALVTNFAAQAVIAIENARLLGELRERTEEVVKLNQQLEQRVADQVGEIERMGRLRRFLPPQVADLIVASGTEKQLESHRS